MIELDKLDKAILLQLQTDATLPLKALAESVQSTVATCQRRIARMQESGIIMRQVAILNTQAVGLSLSAYVQVKMEKQSAKHLQAFEKAMLNEPYVLLCQEISGDYDFLLLVHSRDMDDYHQFTRRVLTSEHNVRSIKSQFVINTVKAETLIALD